jgi:hypothetical protein
MYTEQEGVDSGPLHAQRNGLQHRIICHVHVVLLETPDAL